MVDLPPLRYENEQRSHVHIFPLFEVVNFEERLIVYHETSIDKIVLYRNFQSVIRISCQVYNCKLLTINYNDKESSDMLAL